MKPILFLDFDGTISYDRFWRTLPPEKYDIVQEYMFGGDLALVNEWMRGGKTSEEINALVAPRLGMTEEDLWKVFVQECETMKILPGILEEVRHLRDAYTVVLATGNMDCFMRFTVPALSLEEHFDYISSSYDERLSKTDNNGEVFKKYAAKYGVPLHKCILIDDSVRIGETFKGLGGTFLHAHGEETAHKHLLGLR